VRHRVASTLSPKTFVAVALLVVVGAEAAVVVGGSRLVGLPGLLLVLIASAGWALLASDERVEQCRTLVIVAIGVAFAVALAVPPRTSHDLWSYVMYGRTVSEYHVSPYVHAPADFRHDPLFGHVAAGWQHTKSVYGPLFTGVSSALTRSAGSSELRARLAFQGLATVGVVAALALIWRATRRVAALVFVGLHPAVVTAIVNGGHNDALVGLAILAGALLAARRRWLGAGFALGLGILVKASAGLGLLGIAVWTFRRDRKGAVRLVAVAAVTTLVGYLPAGWSAVHAVGDAGNGGNSRASVWDPISSLLHPSTALMVGAVVVLALFAAHTWRTTPRSSTSALATTAAYLIAGVYVLPWYSAWALPSAALERRSRLAWLVALQAAFLVAVYEYELPAHPTLTGFAAVMRTGLLQVGVWTALAAFFLLLVRERRRSRDRD
jgi:alpha-1,6-mannosyltransferase